MNVVVAGWAGAGKTTIAGTLARIVAAGGADVLIVEDDPPPTLAATLGIAPAGEVAPLPEDLLNRVESPDGEADFVLAKPPQAIVDDYGVKGPAGVTLLKLAAVEHRENPGGRNFIDSAYLTAQKVLTSVLQERDEETVIDGIPAVQHLPRDTIAAVDVLLVVVEPHYKSLEAGRRTAERALEVGFADVRIVANQIHDADQRTAIEAFCTRADLTLGGVVQYDEAIPQAHQNDHAPIDEAPEGAAVRAIGTIAEDLLADHARE